MKKPEDTHVTAPDDCPPTTEESQSYKEATTDTGTPKWEKSPPQETGTSSKRKNR